MFRPKPYHHAPQDPALRAGEEMNKEPQTFNEAVDNLRDALRIFRDEAMDAWTTRLDWPGNPTVWQAAVIGWAVLAILVLVSELLK